MALLGTGFNPSDPTDDDLVKYGASWMRDIKNRLKAWAGVLFETDTGRLKDNVIGSSKLKSLSPDPSGSFNWGSVNTKGQVTIGNDVELPSRGRAVTEIFIGGTLEQSASQPAGVLAPGLSLRFDPDVNNYYSEVTQDSEFVLTSTDATEGEANHWSARKLWTVPTGVTQVRAIVIGGGGGGSMEATPWGGAGGTWALANFVVEPQQQWELWIGSGGYGSTASGAGWDGTLSKMELDLTHWVKCKGGNGAALGAGGTVPFPITVFGYTLGTAMDYIGLRAFGHPGTQPDGGAAGSGIPGALTGNYEGFNYGAGGSGGVAAGIAGGPGAIILDYIY
jgi:hypothetical protein